MYMQAGAPSSSPFQEVHTFVQMQLTELNLKRHDAREHQRGQPHRVQQSRGPLRQRHSSAVQATIMKPVLDPHIYQRFRATQHFCGVFNRIAGRIAAQRLARAYSRWSGTVTIAASDGVTRTTASAATASDEKTPANANRTTLTNYALNARHQRDLQLEGQEHTLHDTKKAVRAKHTLKQEDTCKEQQAERREAEQRPENWFCAEDECSSDDASCENKSDAGPSVTDGDCETDIGASVCSARTVSGRSLSISPTTSALLSSPGTVRMRAAAIDRAVGSGGGRPVPMTSLSCGESQPMLLPPPQHERSRLRGRNVLSTLSANTKGAVPASTAACSAAAVAAGVAAAAVAAARAAALRSAVATSFAAHIRAADAAVTTETTKKLEKQEQRHKTAVENLRTDLEEAKKQAQAARGGARKAIVLADREAAAARDTKAKLEASTQRLAAVEGELHAALHALREVKGTKMTQQRARVAAEADATRELHARHELEEKLAAEVRKQETTMATLMHERQARAKLEKDLYKERHEKANFAKARDTQILLCKEANTELSQEKEMREKIEAELVQEKQAVTKLLQLQTTASNTQAALEAKLKHEQCARAHAIRGFHRVLREKRVMESSLFDEREVRARAEADLAQEIDARTQAEDNLRRETEARSLVENSLLRQAEARAMVEMDLVEEAETRVRAEADLAYEAAARSEADISVAQEAEARSVAESSLAQESQARANMETELAWAREQLQGVEEARNTASTLTANLEQEQQARQEAECMLTREKLAKEDIKKRLVAVSAARLTAESRLTEMQHVCNALKAQRSDSIAKEVVQRKQAAAAERINQLEHDLSEAREQHAAMHLQLRDAQCQHDKQLALVSRSAALERLSLTEQNAALESYLIRLKHSVQVEPRPDKQKQVQETGTQTEVDDTRSQLCEAEAKMRRHRGSILAADAALAAAVKMIERMKIKFDAKCQAQEINCAARLHREQEAHRQAALRTNELREEVGALTAQMEAAQRHAGALSTATNMHRERADVCRAAAEAALAGAHEQFVQAQIEIAAASSREGAHASDATDARQLAAARACELGVLQMRNRWADEDRMQRKRQIEQLQIQQQHLKKRMQLSELKTTMRNSAHGSNAELTLLLEKLAENAPWTKHVNCQHEAGAQRLVSRALRTQLEYAAVAHKKAMHLTVQAHQAQFKDALSQAEARLQSASGQVCAATRRAETAEQKYSELCDGVRKQAARAACHDAILQATNVSRAAAIAAGVSAQAASGAVQVAEAWHVRLRAEVRLRVEAEEQMRCEVDARKSAETGELMARLDIARGEEILSDDDNADDTFASSLCSSTGESHDTPDIAELNDAHQAARTAALRGKQAQARDAIDQALKMSRELTLAKRAAQIAAERGQAVASEVQDRLSKVQAELENTKHRNRELECEHTGVCQALQREQALRKATTARAREATSSLSQKVAELEASLALNALALSESKSRAQEAAKATRKVDAATSPTSRKPTAEAKRLPLRNITDSDRIQSVEQVSHLEPKDLKHKHGNTCSVAKSRVVRGRRAPPRTRKAGSEIAKLSSKTTSTRTKMRSAKIKNGAEDCAKKATKLNRKHNQCTRGTQHAFGRAISSTRA